MASLATLAAVQPTAIKDFTGSSLFGTKLSVKPARRSVRINNSRKGAVVAKYGDKSVYFDLEDLGNTTGQWDLYGSDGPSPYNSLQEVAPSWLTSAPPLPTTFCPSRKALNCRQSPVQGERSK